MKEKIPIPPLLEQQRIVALVCLEKQLARAVSIVSNRLREYRTRLIADVVTGRLDVREAAATLPEELAESEQLEETEPVQEAEDLEPDAAGEEAEA